MTVALPNVRKLFIPDPGYDIYEADLAGADAQVVAAEAADLDLLGAFAKGLDIHDHNSAALWGEAYTSLVGVARAKRRKQTKQAVHGTNYGASARTIAITLGWTIREAESFQERWFTLHPGILDWHGRTDNLLRSHRIAINRFGYRIIYFDRIDGLLPQALAWVPQSTVALVCFKGALQLEAAPEFRLPEFANATDDDIEDLRIRGVSFSKIEILLQVHDSLVFQIRRDYAVTPERIRQNLIVPVPYDPPLVIQWNLKSSAVSWGECKAVG